MEMMLVGQKEEKAVGDLITLSVYIISHINGLGNRCSLAKTEQDRRSTLASVYEELLFNSS